MQFRLKTNDYTLVYKIIDLNMLYAKILSRISGTATQSGKISAHITFSVDGYSRHEPIVLTCLLNGFSRRKDSIEIVFEITANLNWLIISAFLDYVYKSEVSEVYNKLGGEDHVLYTYPFFKWKREMYYLVVSVSKDKTNYWYYDRDGRKLTDLPLLDLEISEEEFRDFVRAVTKTGIGKHPTFWFAMKFATSFTEGLTKAQRKLIKELVKKIDSVKIQLLRAEGLI